MINGGLVGSIAVASTGGKYSLKEEFLGRKANTWPLPVVSSGLVTYLDSANPSSYSGTGTTWYDLSGSGNHMTLANSPSYSAGVLSFNGSNQSAYTTTNSASLTVTTAVTVTSWFKLLSAQTTEVRLISGGTNASTLQLATGWSNPSSSTHRYLLATNGTTGWTAANDFTYATAVGSWFESTMTYDGSVMNIYINGTLAKSATVTGTIATVTQLWVGQYNTTYLNASLPVHLYYNRKLTDAERATNFAAFRGRYGV